MIRDYILAIDAGGSKCDALLVDLEGTIRQFAREAEVGVGGRRAEAVTRAAARALGRRTGRHLHLATVGPAPPPDAFPHPWQQHLAATETQIALAQAGRRHGIVVLAGTGAFVSAALGDGRELLLDGAGPILGDFGGGYHIGTMALNAAVRAPWHPRHATSLRQRLLERFDVRSPRQLFDLDLFSRDRSTVAALAKTVADEAGKGDRVAAAIIHRAAGALAETCRDLIGRLELAHTRQTVVGTGSLIRLCEAYWQSFWRRVLVLAPEFRPCRLRRPPVFGLAVWALGEVLGSPRAAAVSQLRHSAFSIPHE